MFNLFSKKDVNKLSKENKELKKQLNLVREFYEVKNAATLKLLNASKIVNESLKKENEQLKKEIVESKRIICKLNSDFNDLKYPEFSMKFNDLVRYIEQGECVFVTGKAGTGKSYAIRKIYEKYNKLKNIQLTAMTGVAASNINGRTIHNLLGIGICATNINKLTYDILHDNDKELLRNQINEIQTIIVDEISMLSEYMIEYIDTFLRRVRCNNNLFGGIQMIFVGDFLQLPPVVAGTCKYINVCKQSCNYDKNNDINCPKRKNFCVSSNLFDNFKIINFTHVIRQSEDEEFRNELDKIRIGKADNNTKEYLKRLALKQNDAKDDCIRIFSNNDDVKNYNLKMINKIQMEPVRFIASDYQKLINEEKFEICEFDEKKSNNFNFPEKELEFKIGARVILIANIDILKGLCNGAMGTIVGIEENEYIAVMFDNNEEYIIQKHEFCYDDFYENMTYMRKQIPLKLAWAITVHKSQGLTFEKASIDLSNIFAKGQAYVALSRLKNSQGLYFEDRSFDLNKINRVEKEITIWLEKNNII